MVRSCVEETPRVHPGRCLRLIFCSSEAKRQTSKEMERPGGGRRRTTLETMQGHRERKRGLEGVDWSQTQSKGRPMACALKSSQVHIQFLLNITIIVFQYKCCINILVRVTNLFKYNILKKLRQSYENFVIIRIENIEHIWKGKAIITNCF